MLKENRYPNSESLVREFRRIAVEEELEIDCSRKTILRDMKTLEFEFQCPLAFDRARNGYYLKRHDWDFIAPALLDENEMLASVIGARIPPNKRMENNTQKLDTPVVFPRIFGPMIFPSICCRITIRIFSTPPIWRA